MPYPKQNCCSSTTAGRTVRKSLTAATYLLATVAFLQRETACITNAHGWFRVPAAQDFVSAFQPVARDMAEVLVAHFARRLACLSIRAQWSAWPLIPAPLRRCPVPIARLNNPGNNAQSKWRTKLGQLGPDR